tara:strand:+ start:747 stop:935 length:189 start_codon:yes stop_codon:yes gene_type:complete
MVKGQYQKSAPKTKGKKMKKLINKELQKLQRIQENQKRLEELETRLTQMGFYKENNKWFYPK